MHCLPHAIVDHDALLLSLLGDALDSMCWDIVRTGRRNILLLRHPDEFFVEGLSLPLLEHVLLSVAVDHRAVAPVLPVWLLRVELPRKLLLALFNDIIEDGFLSIRDGFLVLPLMNGDLLVVPVCRLTDVVALDSTLQDFRPLRLESRRGCVWAHLQRMRPSKVSF